MSTNPRLVTSVTSVTQAEKAASLAVLPMADMTQSIMTKRSTVSATLPTEQAIAQAQAFDASVSIAERNGQRISFKCADSDSFAQTLLTDLGAWDLEISAPSLEDAFIQLTEDAQ